jgi:hypothetical protein
VIAAIVIVSLVIVSQGTGSAKTNNVDTSYKNRHDKRSNNVDCSELYWITGGRCFLVKLFGQTKSRTDETQSRFGFLRAFEAFLLLYFSETHR